MSTSTSFTLARDYSFMSQAAYLNLVNVTPEGETALGKILSKGKEEKVFSATQADIFTDSSPRRA